MREIVHADNSIWVEIAVFVLGGGAYGLMEILFRGHTHWTMLVTGGACALTLFYLREWLLAQPLAVSALAGAVIILTGIVGSLMGETVCKVCHITDPLAKGLALGTSAHAIGTSKALQMGEIEGAMSGLAIAVAGIMTAILAPVAANFLP